MLVKFEQNRMIRTKQTLSFLDKKKKKKKKINNYSIRSKNGDHSVKKSTILLKMLHGIVLTSY